MTTQIKDKIELDGTEYRISAGQYPLEILFKDDRQKHAPGWHPPIVIPDEEKGGSFPRKKGGWGCSSRMTTNSLQRETYDNSRTKKERL